MKMKGTIVIENGPQGRNVYVQTPFSKLLVSDRFRIGDGLNNKSCTVEMEGGKVMLIECGRERLAPIDDKSVGKVEVVYNRRRDSGGGNRPQQGSRSGQQSGERRARAPYNFVPLNKKIVESEHKEGIPAFDKYSLLSGYIELDIEALTPLYIRGTSKDGDEETLVTDFFGPGGITKIPGSSLRGMVRNLVEIVTWGKFKFFDNRNLYYRAVGDNGPLGKEYRKLLADEQNNHMPIVKAGVMVRRGRNYEIYPAPKIENTYVFKANFDKRTRKVDGLDLALQEFEFRKIYFRPVPPRNHTHYLRLRDGNQKQYQLKYAKITEMSLEPKEGLLEGYMVSSGNLGNKKHFNWVFAVGNREKSLKLNRNSKAVMDYIKDTSKKEETDLLKKLDKVEEVPCFYITDSKGNVIAFGHTGMFRIPYKLSIADHIAQEVENEQTPDISEAIFGKESEYATRVYFDDAVLHQDINEVSLGTVTPQILSGPKPTTFQHYLENRGNDVKNLSNYNNAGVPIRGHKLYWHKKIQGKSGAWAELNPPANSTQHTRINPIRENAIFRGRIRFDNLSPVELGALLFVLDLPEGHFHKIGMAKPLGLGSIRIKPKLSLIDRKRRYSGIFEEDNWNTAVEAEEINAYKEQFAEFILERIQGQSKDGPKTAQLWNNQRLKELKAMLRWDNVEAPNWTEETRYMSIHAKEYRDRPVLPYPTEVVDKAKHN